MLLIDTNILLYAAITSFTQHRKAKTFLDDKLLRRSPIAATWGIFYEFMRVSTHPDVFKKPLRSAESWQFWENIFKSPSFSMLVETDSHSETIDAMLEENRSFAGNLWHDVHIASLMREHGITTIATADSDFHKFPFLKVVNPYPLSGARIAENFFA